MSATNEAAAPEEGHFAFRTRFLNRHEIDSQLIAQWADLDERARTPNGFLSPKFILPAIENLDPTANLIFLGVFAVAEGCPDRLAGFGIFEIVKAHRAIPIHVLKAYQSKHSYLSGLLFDREHLSEVAKEFSHALLKSPMARRWSAVQFAQCRIWAEDFEALSAACLQAGCAPAISNLQQRAILLPALTTSSRLKAHIGSKRIKEFRRNTRRLSELGPLTWRLLTDPSETKAASERFLQLEGEGWRAISRTSLLSSEEDRAFFLKMAAGFADSGRLFIAELLLNDEVIASTLNFSVADQGFAFKIGWRTSYAKYAPGLLNEFSTAEASAELLKHLCCIDSGSEANSFIEAIWPDRYSIGTFVLPRTVVARAFYSIRNLKNSCSRVSLQKFQKNFFRIMEKRSAKKGFGSDNDQF